MMQSTNSTRITAIDYHKPFNSSVTELPHLTYQNMDNQSNLSNENLTSTDDIVHGLLCENIGTCLYTFFVPAICIFGIVGNCCSFRVFICTPLRRSSATICLAALSISDTGFLLILLSSWLGGGRLGIYFGHSVVYCYLSVYCTYVFSFLSVWYIVLIMTERYIVVCHPLRVQTLFSRQTCCVSVITITAFALLLYSHAFITSAVQENECSIRAEYVQIVVIFTYIDTVITFIFPVITVFILNIVVLVAIRRFKEQQKEMMVFYKESDQRRYSRILTNAEVRITCMLITVSMMFIITNLPSHAIRLYIMINRLMESQTTNYVLIGQIQYFCNVLYFSNFAINFVLYSSMSKAFRKFVCYSCSSNCSRAAPDDSSRYQAYSWKRVNGRQV